MALSAGQVSIAVKPDTASFGSELKSGIMGKVGGVGGEMGSAILGGLKAFAGPIAAVTAAFSVKHLIEDSTKAFEDLAGSVKGMQRVVGGSTEGISGLRGAMQLAGVPVDNLNTSMTRFAKNLATATDKGSTVHKMFDEMGVKATDAHGKLLPVDQLLPSLADKFKEMPNGAEKTAAAMALFGRQGATMIPFLNKGSEGIAELTQKAKDMGLVLDDTSMKIFGAARESARNFAAAIQGVKVAIGQDLVPVLDAFQNIARNALTPVLQGVAKFMNENRDSFMKFAEFVEGTGKTAMEGLGSLLKPLGDAFKQLGPVFAQLAPQVMQLMSAFSPFSLVFKALEPLLPSIIGLIANLATTLGTTLAGVLKEILPPISAVVQILVQTLGGVFQQLMPAITLLATTLGTVLGDVVKALAPVIVMLVQAVASLLPPLMPLITQIIQLAVDAVVPLIKALMPLIQAVLPLLVDLLKFLIPIIANVARWLEGILVVSIQVTINVLKVIIGVITNVISWFAGLLTAIVKAADGIGDFFKNLGSNIQKMMSSAGTWLVDAGRNLIEGLINGATAMGGAVSRWISNLGSSIINGFKSMFGIKSPSTVFHGFGVNIAQGLANGVNASVDLVADAMGNLSDATTLNVPSVSIGTATVNSGARVVGNVAGLVGSTAATIAGMASNSATTINYFAAPNDSIDAEQKLVDAVQRAKVLGAV